MIKFCLGSLPVLKFNCCSTKSLFFFNTILTLAAVFVVAENWMKVMAEEEFGQRRGIQLSIAANNANENLCN